MMCQNCNKNEATRTFVMNFMGQQQEVHICDECLSRMWQYAGAMGQRESFRAMAGWWPGKAEPRELGDSPFPARAELDLRLKRHMSSLKIRLREAIDEENYEEAARLRDAIANEEAFSHES